MIDPKVVEKAAREVLEMMLLDELQDVDSTASLPEDKDNDTFLDFLFEEERDNIFLAMGNMIGGIANAWGNDVWLVFYHMGIADSEKDMVRALYLLIMSSLGHGVGLNDDFDDEFDKACSVLGKMKPCPVHYDHNQHFTSFTMEPHLVYADE